MGYKWYVHIKVLNKTLSNSRLFLQLSFSPCTVYKTMSAAFKKRRSKPVLGNPVHLEKVPPTNHRLFPVRENFKPITVHQVKSISQQFAETREREWVCQQNVDSRLWNVGCGVIALSQLNSPGFNNEGGNFRTKTNYFHCLLKVCIFSKPSTHRLVKSGNLEQLYGS